MSSAKWLPFRLGFNVSSHCVLETWHIVTYILVNFGPGNNFIAWQHQAITWTHNSLSSVRSSDINLRTIPQEIPQPLITKIGLKNMSKIPFKSLRSQWVKSQLITTHHDIWHPHMDQITADFIDGIHKMLPLRNRWCNLLAKCLESFHGTSNLFNTLRPRQNGRHFPDDIVTCIILNENVCISLTISLKFVPKVRINNIPALVQKMAWRPQATSHYLNQWWLIQWRIYASLGLNELTHSFQDQMAQMLQMAFFSSCAWMELFDFLKII